jgi:hypothetical protein
MGDMRTDPSETGGLFVGRRPGTAPIRFRALPQRGDAARQRLDGYVANALLVAIVAISLLCWGPIPLSCLWVGSQVSYLTSSTSFGILMALVTLGVLLFGSLVVLRRIDHAWILVRRAAGYDQRIGALGRVFAVTAVVCGLAFAFWFIVIHGPGPIMTHGSGPNQGANL